MESRDQPIQIQYAPTKGGRSIPFYKVGTGPPLIYVPGGPLGFLEAGTEAALINALAEIRTVIPYERGHDDISDEEREDPLSAWVDDLSTIADRHSLDRFALFGSGSFSPVAMAYAAKNPERITRMVLFAPSVKASDFFKSTRDRALAMLMEGDWELWTEVMAHIGYGWENSEEARRFAAAIRSSSTPERVRALFRATTKLDASELVPDVSCPVLILHPQHYQFVDVRIARELAARLPDGRLTVMDSGHVSIFARGAASELINGVKAFLSEADTETSVDRGSGEESVHTILFTDVEGSTALTERLGDAKARELLREHERITREALKAHGGAEVKTMGDGFMTSFGSAVRALECAIALQRGFEARNKGAEEQGNKGEAIRVRIGLNAGEPIAEDDPGGRGDLFGTAVNMAARIAAQADGGEILVSDVVRQLVAGKKFLFSGRGETELRGFEDPVRVYEVRWSFDTSADADGSG